MEHDYADDEEFADWAQEAIAGSLPPSRAPSRTSRC
jgi:hypothetical protein